MINARQTQYTLANGATARFHREHFKEAIFLRKQTQENAGNKQSTQTILEELADATGNSFSAIKHWCAGHNAPSDLDKVQDLAQYLNVSVDFLLEINSEEQTKMENLQNVKINPVDFSSTKSILRSIYSNFVSYIELFRMASVTNTSVTAFKPLFACLYLELMTARLDIPKDTFEQLQSFAVNYLQQLTCFSKYSDHVIYDQEKDSSDANAYLAHYCEMHICPPCAPWSECLYTPLDPYSTQCKLFEKSVLEQFTYNTEINEFNEFDNNIIIETAYQRLNEILEPYMLP